LNKILKFIFPKLFLSEEEKNEIIKDLRVNTNFMTKEQMLRKDSSLKKEVEFKLEKGEVKSILIPDFGNHTGFKITKWYFKTGSNVKAGDIICNIENKKLTMELESIYDGKLISINQTKEELDKGVEICKVEGI
jgi:biotin carboxyl carrier protein